MYNVLRSFIILVFSFLMVACSSLKVENSLHRDAPEPYMSYKIVNVSATDQIDSQVITIFENELRSRFNRFGYKEGDDVTISYDIQAFDPGNRALRMFVGFGLGKGTLNVKTSLKDKSGKSLGSVDTETALKMGFFGGSLNNIIRETAAKVASQIHRAYIISAY